MTIIVFKRGQSEPVQTIECDEFFLYRTDDKDFTIRYIVYEDEQPCEYILIPDSEVYEVEII